VPRPGLRVGGSAGFVFTRANLRVIQARDHLSFHHRVALAGDL
jgi:hypothetical protein